MEISTLIIIIIIITLIALIPGLYFNKQSKKIEDKINKEESNNTNINENMYKIQLEITKMRKLFSTFLVLILIPIFLKLFFLITATSKIIEILNK